MLILLTALSMAGTTAEALTCDGPAWTANHPEQFETDTAVRHGGTGSVRVRRDAGAPERATWTTHKFALAATGKAVQLSGWIKTADVEGRAGLWMRVNGLDSKLSMNTMNRRAVTGTSDWARFDIELPLPDEARTISLGALLVGTGTMWMDDLTLSIDGVPLHDVTSPPPTLNVLDRDRTFDEGSGIELADVTPAQVQHLALLAKVWGMAKYHHPAIVRGTVHWDYALLRMLPAVLAASDLDAAARIIDEALQALGDVAPCDPCAESATSVHLQADLAWIDDVPEPLRTRLRTLHTHRAGDHNAFYIGQVRGVGNPIFRSERTYESLKSVDVGFRLLALFRYWNVVHYWFPYRDQIDDDWHDVLAESIPPFVAATSPAAYEQALAGLAVATHDGHASVSPSTTLPPTGNCLMPVSLRWLRGQAVVWHSSTPELPAGSVVHTIDGVDVAALASSFEPYIAASNQAALDRSTAARLSIGPCAPAALTASGADGAFEVSITRKSSWTGRRSDHDRGGESVQRLADDIQYIRMSGADTIDAKALIKSLRHDRGLVIDLRNYPSSFLLFELGNRLVSTPTPFARFTMPQPTTPGEFAWGHIPELRRRGRPFAGRVMVLVDEVTMSSAEYHAMAFRVAPNALVIGSTTAGADGNVSTFALPGGYRGSFSGIGVFTPTNEPAQRVGVEVDVEAIPTAGGIASGRDEVLEEALRQLGGFDEAQVRAMAARP